MTSRSEPRVEVRVRAETAGARLCAGWLVELTVSAGASACKEDLAHLYFALDSLNPVVLLEDEARQMRGCLLVWGREAAEAGGMAVDAVGALPGVRIESTLVRAREEPDSSVQLSTSPRGLDSVRPLWDCESNHYPVSATAVRNRPRSGGIPRPWGQPLSRAVQGSSSGPASPDRAFCRALSACRHPDLDRVLS